MSECQVWPHGRFKSGYGAVKKAGRMVGAHRVAWESAHGPIPEGMSVLHHCDNPPCINPEHLFLGTDADNVRDMWAKGRAVPPPVHQGETHHRARLTPDKVRELRRLRATGVKLRVLADLFGVSVAVVSKVARRQAWEHVA